jgi:hypothetical protein
MYTPYKHAACSPSALTREHGRLCAGTARSASAASRPTASAGRRRSCAASSRRPPPSRRRLSQRQRRAGRRLRGRRRPTSSSCEARVGTTSSLWWRRLGLEGSRTKLCAAFTSSSRTNYEGWLPAWRPFSRLCTQHPWPFPALVPAVVCATWHQRRPAPTLIQRPSSGGKLTCFLL